MKSYGVAIQMKPLQQYVHIALLFYYFNLLVLTIEPVDEILLCDHSNETSSAFIWHGPLLGCLGLNYSTAMLN